MPTVCRSHQTNRSYCFLAGVFALCLGALAMPHAEAQTIHQLAYNNSTWIDQDLSSQTTSTAPRMFTNCSSMEPAGAMRT